MNIIYRWVVNLILIFSPIIIIYRILKGKENYLRVNERYAFNLINRPKGKLIWIHASSIGEFNSMIPLIEKFQKNQNISRILITTNTLSSGKLIGKLKLNKTIHQFFPLDSNFIIKKFLNHWKPSALILCESEIWPNLIQNIHKRKIKLILINARITLKAFNNWKKISNFRISLFKKFDLCLSQNNETFYYLQKLGAKNIKNLGNLKYSTSKSYFRNKLKKYLFNYFKGKKLLLTSASIHPDEVDFSLKNHYHFLRVKKIKNIISIIAPRHIESTKNIIEEAEKLNLSYHLHSSKSKVPKHLDIYIVDTYGDLQKFYQVSNLVFIGGSLIKHGGQNPLEAVKLNCKIIHGPNIANFKDIFKTLKKLKLSSKFNTYQQGYKIVEKNLRKSKISKNSKNLLRYGDKILNNVHSEVSKFIK